ncbi:S-layer homology domain-containing protein [Paenibacillus monticola]|uniref:SLH domain-containing protein n=1 Tax=Paenibacillus monticola TaxID=2666075 RepID=A0A7X2L068_9BACL|nr:S-layer homology domain-containing protein [Paenibacillus monticola]MRN51760.1 hypothetical protein [Paenibacillus monticola]
MKRFRSAVAGLLAMLLIFSGFPVYGASGNSAGAGVNEGTGAGQIPAGTVLIKNKWKSNFLYETSTGEVRYGMTNLADTSSHWTVVTTAGLSRIQNVKTGHYITLAGNTGKEDSLKAAEISGASSTTDQWLIDTSNRNGYMVIRSATAPEGKLVIHEENQLGFAQVSGDINVTFESPQWAFVDLNAAPGPISELQAIRLATYTDAQVATDFLYEATGGELKHGIIAPDTINEADYLWFVEDYDGHKRIRNAATNHYLTSIEGTAKAQQLNESQPTDQWVFNESDDYDDYQTIENIGNSGTYLATLGNGNAGASTDNTTLAAQWQLLDPNTPTDSSEHFYRIQNGWKSFYWYESSNGLLKYGNMQADGSDQWLIEKYNGRKLFKNKKTGHYLNMVNMPDGHLQVTELPDKNAVDQSYIWTGKNTGDNNYVISNIADKEPNKRPEKYISLQNLTKYAEYGVINPGWGSPKWKFVAVTEKKQDLFRFKLNDVNGEKQYLKDGPLLAAPSAQNQAEEKSVTEAVYNSQKNEAAAPQEKSLLQADASATEDMTVGQATYGVLKPNDDSFVWQLQEIEGSNGAVKIKNRGTGRYLSLEHIGNAVEEVDPDVAVQTLQTVYDVWGSIKWIVDMQPSGLTTFKSAWAGHYMYGAPNANGNPVIRISKAVDAADKESAHFSAEAVTEATPPVPAYPVRFKNANSGEYLYENEHGVVLYGQPSADNGYSQWNISTQAGKQSIVNRATGHYLTLNGDYSFLESSSTEPAADGSSDWVVSLASDNKHYTIRSLFGEYSDEFVHVENHTGYAERGLLLESESSVQWTLETAEQEFNTPAGEPRNHDTATPVQQDTNIVTIVPKGIGGKVLAEQAGKAVYVDAADKTASIEWLVQDYNGRKRIMNVQSNHYLSFNEANQAVLLAAGGKETSQWILEEKLGYKQLLSADESGLLTQGESTIELGTATAGDHVMWSFLPVPMNVVYSGAEAFQGEGVIRFAVNANSAAEYAVVIGYKNESTTDASLIVKVNGLEQGNALNLKSSSIGQNVSLKLKLRAGINTVSLSAGGNTVWNRLTMDTLTVLNSVNKTYRGATVPYISYEAEDAVTNGTIIGPSRKYLSIASEASGRQAVMLKNTGDYVEFKLANPANSIVLRYSIPDSPDGTGAEDTLSLYVNGVQQQLHLTSKYAWEYGSYPWSNDPRQGSGHRFFDEIHALIGDAPAGATIRLEKTAGDHAASYTLDLADMEQVAPALTEPEGFVSVTDYGAVANDQGEDTAAFKAALAEANQRNTGVWFPAGAFNVGDGLLDLNAAEIRGAGMWYTTLNGAKFYGHGEKIGVYDLLIDGGVNVREDEAYSNAFHGAFGQGSVIQNVWIEHTKAGLWLTQPVGEKARTDGLHMVELRIRNLMADGINFAVGTGNSMMEQSDIRYPGDDGIAMWSFTDAKLNDVNGTERTPSFNNTARFNTVSLPWLADNIVVFGGKDNKIQDNVVKDTVSNGAGIAVSTRFSAEPFQGTTLVERNTLLRTGSYDSGYGVNLGALWLYAGESDLFGTVLIRNNTALDSTYSGLIAHGNLNMTGVVLTNNVIDRVGTSGVEVTPELKGNLLVDNLIIRGERMNLLSNPSSAFNIVERNQGFASAVKPFSIKLTDGQSGPVVLKQGESAGIQVLNREGADITSQAAYDFENVNTASVSEGELHGLKPGSTIFTVTVGNSKRTYTIDVIPPVESGGGGPTDPTGPTGPTLSVPTPVTVTNNDALLKAKTAAGQAVIELAANADGTARFSAEALRSAAAVSPNAVLVIQSGNMSYRFPLELLETVLSNAKLPEGTLEFKFTLQSGTVLEQITASAKQQGLRLHGTPVGFTLSVTDGITSVPVSDFGTQHVERTFTINEVLDNATAVALLYDNENGSFRYVPAIFESANGVTIVTIKSSMASGVFTVAIHPVSFPDISGHWAQAEIERLASRFIVNGQSMGSFAPETTISRAEFAAMLIRSLDLQPDPAATANSSFRDVQDSSWFAAAARAAAGLGLVQGYADGSFRPNTPITREQMAVMVARALKLVPVEADLKGTSDGSLTFKDAAGISTWAKEAVDTLGANGIMKGQSAGNFAPSSDTSRAEAAVILSRLLIGAKLLNN